MKLYASRLPLLPCYFFFVRETGPIHSRAIYNGSPKHRSQEAPKRQDQPVGSTDLSVDKQNLHLGKIRVHFLRIFLHQTEAISTWQELENSAAANMKDKRRLYIAIRKETIKEKYSLSNPWVDPTLGFVI